MEFTEFIHTWDRYRHVWEVDREDTIAIFVKKKPNLKNFEDELSKYNMAQSQLTTEKTEYRLVLKFRNVSSIFILHSWLM